MQDIKWQLYSEFCSSLSVVCPAGLIKPEEIDSPFGLVYVTKNVVIREYDGKECIEYILDWQKKPKNLQGNKSLAWTFKYLSVIETEFRRVVEENKTLKVFGLLP